MELSHLDSKGVSYQTVFLLLVAEMVLIGICVVSWKKWSEYRMKKERVRKISSTFSGNVDRINYKSMDG